MARSKPAARAAAPVAKPTVTCDASECSNEFVPQRSTARYCSATCRQRARRTRAAAKESVAADAENGLAEHDLVKAVRLELEAAGKLTTFKGQLALQLARKLVTPEEAGVTALAKELQALMKDALAAVAPPSETEPAAPAEDDQVIKARKAKEAKAAAAAGGA